MCFDYGFGPFRWVCTSGDPKDLAKTDELAAKVLEELAAQSPKEIQQQMHDNIRWIKAAAENHLVVGSSIRRKYSKSPGKVNLFRTHRGDHVPAQQEQRSLPIRSPC